MHNKEQNDHLMVSEEDSRGIRKLINSICFRIILFKTERILKKEFGKYKNKDK